MSNMLRKRLEDLENTSHIFELTPPPKSEKVRAAKESFRDAIGALRQRTGGERIDHSEDDPVVGELAREARSAFRHYIRVSRGGHHDQP